MEAAPADAAVAAGESPFLRCITLLNDDVLTRYLLPKLVEQGSAAAVALTCSRLRRLCQHSTLHLNLAKELEGADSPWRRPVLAERLVEAFPNCTSFACALDSSGLEDVYLSIRIMLSGLPHLSAISIWVDSIDDGELDPVLCQLHMHATGLRSLNLQLSDSWVDHAMTWDSLGKMADLTGLELTFDNVELPCVHSNLQSLTGMSKLQSLVIQAPESLWDGWEQPYYFHGDETVDDTVLHAAQKFPGPLTSLTRLCLPLTVTPILGSFSKCVGLQDLQLRSTNGVPKLSPVAWAALAQLSSLTRLYVDIHFQNAGEPEAELYYGVLRQLQGLKEVGACVWLHSFLPLLQTLTHVTYVHGSWKFGGTDAVDFSGVGCPHVRALGNVINIPTSAFPNLESVSFEFVSIREVMALSRCCTSLQKLSLLHTHSRPVYGGVDGSPERLAAFASLAQLQHLTHLDLAPSGDAELVAFTSAAAAASSPQLLYLDVRGELTLFALMQLQSVRGLKELHVHVGDSQGVRDTFTQEAVRMWLVGLAVVPKVCLVLRSAEQQGVFYAASRWAAQLGLPLPAVLKISMV